ncbi:MAG TPA: DUF362 domain-containing protein [Chitinispirillaceae bacterium]|nr:DUF362 domain-containing protein [Chitinispirillaceae bacterium]
MKRSVVALVRCESYNPGDVNSAVERGFSLLGGVSQFLDKGKKKVLLKPNVLWGVDPKNCVTTHPSVFKAVASIFLSAGAQVWYGDSPAGITGVSSSLKKAGLSDVAQEMGVQQADFENGRSVTFNEGIAGKKLFIANAVFDCDTFVSLSKLKTHGLTRITGAIKNQYGCVPGMVKGEYHARFPDVYDFANLLADITRFVSPKLFIMDAVYAMEGNGPQSGTPKKCGLLLFSTDPVALDTVACRIVDLDPGFVPTIDSGVRAGLGTSDISAIDIVGEQIEQYICKDFDVVRRPPVRIPRSRLFLEIRNHFTARPAANASKCIRCGRCVEACPVDPKAVELPKNASRPRYNYRRCIRCFCCQEVCPAKAIAVHDGILKKLFPFASFLSLMLTTYYSKRRK